jgi:hypothetical protein
MSADIDDTEVAAQVTATLTTWARRHTTQPDAGKLAAARQRMKRRRATRLAGSGASVLVIVAGAVAITLPSDSGERQSSPPAAATDISVVGDSAEAQEVLTSVQRDPSAPQPLPTETSMGPLIGSDLAATSAPLILVGDSDWELSYVYGSDDSPLGDIVIGTPTFVGPGPRYDAPMVSARRFSGEPLDDSLGRKVTIQGSDALMVASEADPDTKIPGPILSVYWVGTDGLINSLNSTRIPETELLALAETAVEEGAILKIKAPAGYSEITNTATSDLLHIEVQLTNGVRDLQVTGSNLGTDSMLGRIGAEIRTTKIINGVEIAYRHQPGSPGSYWADWRSGDWWFYAPADGMATEQEYLDLLASLVLVSEDEFAAAGSALGLVMPGDHPDLLQRLTTDVPVLDSVDLVTASRAAVATTERDFGFGIYLGLGCSWSRAAVSGTVDREVARQALESAAAQATANGIEAIGEELRQLQNELAPEADRMTGFWSNDCPLWSGI